MCSYAYVTILRFRAVIDGVHTSRRTLDLDASSFAFLSFLSFPPLIQLVPTQTRRARLPVCARKPTARRTSGIYSSYTISSHRPRCRRRGVVHRRRASSTSYPPTSPPSRLARDRRAHRQSLRTFESRRRGDGYSRWSRPLDTSTERRHPSRLVLVLARASSSPPFPSSISRARPAFTMV